MTHVNKKLVDPAGEQVGRMAAHIDFDGEVKRVTIVVSGVILGEHAQELYDFMRDVSCFPADEWILRLGELTTTSGRGLSAIAKLTRILTRKGTAPVFETISPELEASLRSLKGLREFTLNIKRPQTKKRKFEVN